MLHTINQTIIPTIDIKNTLELKYIARFVNKYTEWTEGKLYEAFDFLHQFMNDEDPLPKIDSTFITGLQTPNNINAVNACVLYKICIYHKLNINTKWNLDDLYNAVNLLHQNVDVLIRKTKFFIDKYASSADLINILLLSNQQIHDPEPENLHKMVDYNSLPHCVVNHCELSKLYDHLTDISILQKNVDPSTDVASISLAAINYHIDISKCSNPTREYKIICKSVFTNNISLNNYKPLDPWLSYWYTNYPELFDLTITFNPLFPKEFYDESLIIMAEREGYTPEEIAIDDPYQLMQLAYITDTFYDGRRPCLKRMTTIIDLDDINDVPKGQLLCYGINNESFDECGLYPITIQEMIDLLNNNRNFTSPFYKNTVLSSTCIRKLKYILQDEDSLSSDTIKLRKELLEKICELELISGENNKYARILYDLYHSTTEEFKKSIEKCLHNLLQIGMYMRGWNGKGSYPIVKSWTLAKNEINMSINITNAIHIFEQSCQDLMNIGNFIKDLPLVIFRDGTFQHSSHENEGFTVGDRIKIIKEGDQTQNVSSCIRLSSNWLCSSAYKYIVTLNLPAPFDIVKLRHIS